MSEPSAREHLSPSGLGPGEGALCLGPAGLEGIHQHGKQKEGGPGAWLPGPSSQQRQCQGLAGVDSSLPLPVSWARALLRGPKPPPREQIPQQE